MSKIRSFVNNPYQEKPYILFEKPLQSDIIDPELYTASQQNAVMN